MTRRQRRERTKRRRTANSRRRRMIAAGAGISAGAVLASGGVAQADDFTVTNLDDTGAGSLRDAIADANANAGPDRVLFQSTLSGQIAFDNTSPEMAITGPLEIIGNGIGAIYIQGGDYDSRIFNVDAGDGNPVSISNLRLLNGEASNASGGGGILVTSGDLTLERSQIESSSTSTSYSAGGAIAAADPDSTVTVLSSELSSNVADGDGGAIAVDGADLVVRDSTLSENQASLGLGGGIHATDSTLTLERSTVSGNSTGNDGQEGGGLFLGTGVTATLNNSTIAENETGSTAGSDTGGGIHVDDVTTTLNLTSTIVSRNYADPADGDDIYRANGTVNATASLINSYPAGTINGTDVGNLLGDSAQMSGLESNGGLTPTHALTSGSNAEDQGINASTVMRDQRGAARPVDDPGEGNNPDVPSADGTDIGAFEIQDDGDQTVTNLNDAGTGSLHSAVIASNDDNDDNDVLFQPGLTGTIPTTNGELALETPVDILGPGADEIAVDGGGRNRVFDVDPDNGEVVNIEDLTITGGRSIDSNGAGIRHQVGDLTLDGVELKDNNAAIGSSGGGFASGMNPDSLTIEDSTVSGNTAQIGAGLYLQNAPTSIYSSTISGNEATGGEGGGIYSTYGLTVLDSTVARNEASGNGAGISLVLIGNGLLGNTVVADNTTGASNPDLDGPFDASFTLVETPGTATINETTPDSNILGQDPQLQPLALNEGTTRTHALPETSPALEKGNSSFTTDQRGVDRPVDFASIPNSMALGADGSDMGAFELEVPPTTPPGGGGTTPTTPANPVPPVNPAQPKPKSKCKKRKKGKAGSRMAAIAKKCKRRKKK